MSENNVAHKLSSVLVATTIIIGLLQLGVRLKEVQIDGAADFNYASLRQSVRRVQVGGLRGRILDRHGEVLAGNRSSVSIVCRPTLFQKRTWGGTVDAISNAIENVSTVIGLKSPLSATAIKRHVNQSLAMPLFVWRDIGERELAIFAEHENELAGFETLETEERVYPNNTIGAHLIGYVGRDHGEVEAGDEKFNFASPELRGRAGVELYYDSFLRGVTGESKLLVDARGFAIKEWVVANPLRGPDLRLTIDCSIQKEVEQQLKGLRGACVVMDAKTGEVLAMASAPGFNPNNFVPTLRADLYERYAGDIAKPLLNRAAGGAYAPGSTFKPVTALAGLAAGYNPAEEYYCSGVISLGSMNLHCASRWGHGGVDMRHGLMKSCNPYFGNLGLWVGTNNLFRAARALGLGAKTGIDFGIDMAGTIPDAEWKQHMYGEKWFQGDLLQMSIGQGMLLVSPLQMARLVGAIGTGYLVTPRLKLGSAVEKKKLPFAESNLNIVREGMRMVVAGDGVSKGTGWRGGEGVSVGVAGKTGTAEIGRGDKRRKNTWFIAYAPAEDPSIAISMVIENGESGGGTTAPRVGAVLKAIFNDR